MLLLVPPSMLPQNASDFYRWLGELEAARSSETEGKFRRYGAALEGHLAAADALLADVKEVGGRAVLAMQAGVLWRGGGRCAGRDMLRHGRTACAHNCGRRCRPANPGPLRAAAWSSSA